LLNGSTVISKDAPRKRNPGKIAALGIIAGKINSLASAHLGAASIHSMLDHMPHPRCCQQQHGACVNNPDMA
jgi:hypothetical protein